MSRLKHQIEQIADETDSDRCCIIIAKSCKSNPVLRKVADVLSRRMMVTNARQVLPCPTMLGKGLGRTETESLFLNLDNGRERALTVEELKQEQLNSMAPLLSSQLVQDAIRESQTGQQNFDPLVGVFWPAQAICITIARDDLGKLLDLDTGDIEVFPNRSVPKPNAALIKAVPPLVIPPAPSAWGVQRINALAVWGAHKFRGAGIKIGILDSGIDATHPDLMGKVESWAEFDKCGHQVYSKPHDAGNHGTICAGTLVGGNKSGQWLGVAPEAKLAVALVFDEAGAAQSQILAGMTWAIEQKVDVLNISLGRFIEGPEAPPYYACAIVTCLAAGILPVFPIGNEGEQTSDTPGNDLMAFAVGATGFEDQPAGFSGGRTQIIKCSPVVPPDLLPIVYRKPDVAAPGVAIRTTVPQALAPTRDNPWDYFSGTSMSTAHVSGAIALLLGTTNIRKVTQGYARSFLIEDLITGAVEELGESGLDARFGFGRIDILRSIAYAHECGYKP